ncbi:GNAT family N-acetyltransferase [Winogradskyella sp. A3E31]|uniref:GNAT family N-acetyltransferase n=1 Tax=Winogradskyella sp. A3E31 TaxID=3349637 RepID=UPI00398AF47F
MDIQHSEFERKGEFYYEKDGNKLGLMTYSKAGPSKIIIDHTEVDPSLQGEGVGYKLVEAAVEYARENDIKIMPLCPFANAVFKKREEYRDLLF